MQGGYIRQERPYVTFAALLVTQKREKKKKLLYDSIGSSRRRPLQTKTQVQSIEKNKNIHSIPSAHRLHPRPPTLLCGRADNACTNLLGFFV